MNYYKFIFINHSSAHFDVYWSRKLTDNYTYIAFEISFLLRLDLCLRTHCRCREVVAFDHTHTHTHTYTYTLDSVGKRSACRRDLYPKTHTTHKRHMHPPAGFEPTFPASEPETARPLGPAAFRWWDTMEFISASTTSIIICQTSHVSHSLIMCRVWDVQCYPQLCTRITQSYY
jgi:hypothetical protein